MMIHVYKDGRELGPYTLDEIKARLHSGTVSQSDIAAVDGGAQMSLGALLGTVLVDEFASPSPTQRSATVSPQPTSARKVARASSPGPTGRLYESDDSTGGCFWVIIVVLAGLALLGAIIYFRIGNNGESAGIKIGTTPPPVAETDQTPPPNDEGTMLADQYLRTIDNSLGLIHIENLKKGRSYISHGERGIREGITVQPTMVGFTAWGFEGKQLKRFLVVSAWLCFEDDFGGLMAAPDGHEVHPIAGDTPAKGDVPQLGSTGMTAVQMEQLCGPAIQSSTTVPEDAVTRRVTWGREGYIMDCQLFAGVVYSVTYSRQDRQKANNTDEIIWLIQNGIHWSNSGDLYKCTDNDAVATLSTVGGQTGRYTCLQVTDQKALTMHPELVAAVNGSRRPPPTYPAAARMAHVQGNGLCHIVFGVTGHVASAVMKQSTGSDILDRNTVEFVEANWTGPSNSSCDAPIRYRME